MGLCSLLGLMVEEFGKAALASGAHLGEWECSPPHVLIHRDRQAFDDVPRPHGSKNVDQFLLSERSGGYIGEGNF